MSALPSLNTPPPVYPSFAPDVVAASKPFYRSKTFWANALMVVATYTDLLPIQYAPYVGAAVNFALRFLTKQAVTLLP